MQTQRRVDADRSAGYQAKSRSNATPLRTARVDRLLSIRELAKEADVAPSTVFLIESGRVRPRPRVMRSLAAVLGIDPHEVHEFRQAVTAAQTVRRSNQRSG